MKWLRLTTKECDMLDYAIQRFWDSEYSTGEAPIPGETFKTHRDNYFSPEEMIGLRDKVQTAYWDKDTTE